MPIRHSCTAKPLTLLQLGLFIAATALVAGCGGGGNSGAANRAVTLGDEPAPKIPHTGRMAPPTRPAPEVKEAEGPTGGEVSARLVTHGPRKRRAVALTFDADMTQGMVANLRSGRVPRYYDDTIVSYLRSMRARATVFSTGLFARVYPRVVTSLAADPLFEIENHSFDHAGWRAPCYGLPSISGEGRKRDEVERTAAILERVTGARPRYFRFPGGCHTRADAELVASLAEQPVAWDVVSGDPFQSDPAVVVRNVLEGVRPGSIVVMHLNGAPNAPATSRALRTIVPALRQRGYRFVTLEQLLGTG
jgi:peptidoglycan-N-acetylglucosamine deacetylase